MHLRAYKALMKRSKFVCVTTQECVQWLPADILYGPVAPIWSLHTGNELLTSEVPSSGIAYFKAHPVLSNLQMPCAQSSRTLHLLMLLL